MFYGGLPIKPFVLNNPYGPVAGAGGYPVGGYPAGGYPAGGYPAGGYPAGGAMMFSDFNKFISDLATAINDEYEAAKFYTELAAIAPCEEARDFILHARDDEKKHYSMFCRLYLELTGRQPVVSEPNIQMPAFCTGVMKSVKDELEAAEMYREMLLATTSMRVRDIMFVAMTDEMEHATRFTFVYSMADCHVDECEAD